MIVILALTLEVDLGDITMSLRGLLFILNGHGCYIGGIGGYRPVKIHFLGSGVKGHVCW